MRKYEKLYLLQERMSKQVIRVDELSCNIKYIAGADVSYYDSKNITVGALVVLDAETLEVVDSAYSEMEIVFPYISGLFSFREMPPLLAAFQNLSILPDLIICDAQGIAHPRNFGLACHLGLQLNIPTIGCAKTRLAGRYDIERLNTGKGSMEDLILKNEIVGKVLRTKDNTKPLFVSVGHKICLDTAVKWVLKATPKYRLPETTRQADRLVGELMQNRLRKEAK